MNEIKNKFKIGDKVEIVCEPGYFAITDNGSKGIISDKKLPEYCDNNYYMIEFYYIKNYEEDIKSGAHYTFPINKKYLKLINQTQHQRILNEKR